LHKDYKYNYYYFFIFVFTESTFTEGYFWRGFFLKSCSKGKSYIEKLKVENPEKLKAYWKKAYEKRKLKQNNIIL
jgi:hypothetical protein